MNSQTKFTVEAIEKWKSSLPLSNLTESTRLLYQLLTEIQHAALSPKQRFEVLCSLRLTVSYLSKNLYYFCIRQGVPNESQRIIADLINGLYLELYEGFKTIVEDIKYSPLHPFLLPQALQNVMHYCAEMLIHAYQYHRIPRQGLWFDLHQYFLFAERKGVLNRTLPKVSSWKFQLKTLNDIYKHCLLFSISNPYHLRQDEIDYLTYALEAWAPLLELSSENIHHALYVVDCISDYPPRYASKISLEKKELYYLQLSRVNQRLIKLISARKQEAVKEKPKELTAAEYKLPFNFLNNLLTTWQHISERINPREQTHEVLNTVLTIASVHWHIIHPNPQNEPNSLYPIYNAKMVDRSETGYCLQWPENPPHTLQNGELIGIPRIASNGAIYWETGVIRWLRHEESILIGVQKISNNAFAVTAKPSELQITHPIPTLLLPKETNKPITLITPLLPFKAGQTVEIFYNEKSYSATLHYTREQTAGYQEFELDFIEEPLICPSTEEFLVENGASS